MERRRLALLGGAAALAGAGAGLFLWARRLARPWSSWVAPIPGAVASSGWGDAREYRDGLHEGLDFPAPVGTDVRAAGSGTVVYAAPATNAGNMLVIDHGDDFQTRYLHLSQFLVGVGDRVARGQVVARSGASGISTSAPHLHFDVRAGASGLAKYRAAFGTPDGGFPARGAWWAVPAEPLGPWILSDRVVARAEQNGVVIG